MVLYLLAMHRPLEGTLPILGLYAFATVRLLPALQAVFTALSSLRFYSSTVGVLGRELENAPPRRGREATVALGFERELRLLDVSFSYAGAGKPVLERVSLSLGAGEWVVFVGPTGSGKSTLVDLMLGLLEPTSGVIEVDGTPLTPETARAWQMLAGYVPQQIFLIDDTIEANICFGIEKSVVDRERLEHVAGLAQIHDFVTKELPDGYQTVVGDRGVRLSGGQRQRLGIARALYRAPRFLVLDEATSALDGATEAAFFEALRRDLAGCTVVSITHRKSTARSFDRAYVLEGGVITAEPDPRELAAQATA
jgi:ABC-type multidrug transport system fused ATPase/permease subunit